MTDYVLTGDGSTPPIFLNVWPSKVNKTIVVACSSDASFTWTVDASYSQLRDFLSRADQRTAAGPTYQASVPWITIGTGTSSDEIQNDYAMAAVRLTISSHTAGSAGIQVMQAGHGFTQGATDDEILALQA